LLIVNNLTKPYLAAGFGYYNTATFFWGKSVNFFFCEHRIKNFEDFHFIDLIELVDHV